MANFGFSHLAVVSPYIPHWREARSAVGAPELLRSAREVATLADAVTDRTLVIGTGTLTHHKPEQPVISLPALAPVVAHELDRDGRIALVFGPEKHGLTRKDLSWCQAFVEIPTDVRQPSMNLGQAAAVCLYELATRVSTSDTETERARNAPPLQQDVTDPPCQVISISWPRLSTKSWLRRTILPSQCGRPIATPFVCCCEGSNCMLRTSGRSWAFFDAYYGACVDPRNVTLQIVCFEASLG